MLHETGYAVYAPAGRVVASSSKHRGWRPCRHADSVPLSHLDGYPPCLLWAVRNVRKVRVSSSLSPAMAPAVGSAARPRGRRAGEASRISPQPPDRGTAGSAVDADRVGAKARPTTEPLAEPTRRACFRVARRQTVRSGFSRCDGSEGSRGLRWSARDVPPHGAFLPVIRARARSDSWRISRRICSTVRWFAIHSR